MDLAQLRYFAEVIRLGTYAEAAGQLSVSQPALWKRVNNLERELDVQLFERIGRRVRPTAAGRQLAEQAQAVLAAAERMRAEATAISRGHRGEVRLVCAPPHLERLAAVIAQFLADHPDVDLKIIEAGEIRPDHLLASGTADVVTGSQDETVAGGFPLYMVSVVAILPPEQRVADLRQLSVAELKNRPLLTAPDAYYSRVELERACAREGFEPTILIESANASALAALADQGAGVAVVADDALPGSRRGRYPVLSTDGEPIRRAVWCYWKSGYAPAEMLASTIKRAMGSTPRSDREAAR